MLALAIDKHGSESHDVLKHVQGIIARQFLWSLVKRRDGRDLRRSQSPHFEIEAQWQREAAERGAEADKTRPEKERGLALATAAVNRRRSRIAIVGALAAVVFGLVALRGHAGGLVSAQFSPNGRTVLTVSLDKTARLWDVASGQELRALRGHEDAVVSVQFSANGKTVLTASYDETARLWDVASGQELEAPRGHAGGVVSAQFSADGRTVLTASLDKTARLWDVASAKELRALRGHADRVVDAQFSDDEWRLPGHRPDPSARALTRRPWRPRIAPRLRGITVLTLAFAPVARAVPGPRRRTAEAAACRPPGLP